MAWGDEAVGQKFQRFKGYVLGGLRIYGLGLWLQDSGLCRGLGLVC